MKRTALYSSLIGTLAGVALATGVFWQSNHMSAAPQVVVAQDDVQLATDALLVRTQGRVNVVWQRPRF